MNYHSFGHRFKDLYFNNFLISYLTCLSELFLCEYLNCLFEKKINHNIDKLLLNFYVKHISFSFLAFYPFSNFNDFYPNSNPLMMLVECESLESCLEILLASVHIYLIILKLNNLNFIK